MKKILYSLGILLLSISATAQNTSDKKIAENIAHLKAAKTASDFQTVGSRFAAQASRADVESGWHANYYAALSSLKAAEMDLRAGKTENLKKLADDATEFLAPFMKMEVSNSEVRLLMAYSHFIKMNIPDADKALELKKAQELLYLHKNVDAANPRFDLLRAQIEYYVLKDSKSGKNLKEHFQNAASKLKAFDPKSKNDPNWGFEDAKYYLTKFK